MPLGFSFSPLRFCSHSRLESSSSAVLSPQNFPQHVEDRFDHRQLEKPISAIQIRPPPQLKEQKALQIAVKLKPKSATHLELLAKCAGFEAPSKIGNVSVALSRDFLEWASKLDKALVEQAYVDAVYLSGKACPSLSDCFGLNQEAQIDRRWSQDDIISLKAIHSNARSLLQEYACLRSSKKQISRSEMKEMNYNYAAATAGAKLADDYLYFQRAIRFRQELSTLLSKSESPKKLAQALASMKHVVPTGKTELALALRRLHMRYEQECSPRLS